MLSFSPLLRRAFIVVFLAALSSPGQIFAQEDTAVPVRLMRNHAPRTVIVSSTGPLTLYAGDPTNPIDQISAGAKLTITTSNQQVYFRSSAGNIFARSLILVQQDDADLTIEIGEGRSIPPPRSYKGAFVMQVDPAETSILSIVNNVEMEDYVAGVLASEFNFRDLEASKAVAVCIRTLAYRALLNQTDPGFAMPDDEMWQVYGGTGSINPTIIQAVQSTRGQVLHYGNEFAEAVYFASSGGHTANNEDVWTSSQSLPYLRGKPDPYDRSSPNHSWESTIPRNRLLSMLSQVYGFEVTDIEAAAQSRDGRINLMRLSGRGQQKLVPGNEFRLNVSRVFGRESLRSTMFEINEQPDLYIFIGKGFGHGVGLNQWGALELAKKGNLYNEILGYYFDGLMLGHGDQLTPLLAASPPADAMPPAGIQAATVENVSPAAPSTSSYGISNRLFGADDGGDVETFEEEVPQDRQQRGDILDDTGRTRTLRGAPPFTWNARAEAGAVQTEKPARTKRIGW